jgi:membrane protease YdiL (CAAX protease family)
MARIARFLRSVLPADPTQLIFLLGLVCLLVSTRLRWNMGLVVSPGEAYEILRASMYFALLPGLFASLAGYYLCFWPVRRLVGKVIFLVICPAMVSLGGAIYLLYHAFGPQSVLVSNEGGVLIWRWAFANDGNFASGLQLCFVGILLCLAFLSRLVFGLTSLPLAVVSHEPIGEDVGLWRNCKALIFILIGPVFLLWGLLGLSSFVISERLLSNPDRMSMLYAAVALFDAVCVALLPVLFLRANGWNLIKRALRLPEPRYVLFASLAPVIVAVATSVGQFLAARVEWAHQLVRVTPPELDKYFVLGGLHLRSILQFAPGAFAEEIIFRGVLLALLTKRYGLHRGVFFTGIIWAAYHFPSDSYAGMPIGVVAIYVAHRIVICLALNYVLGWMTMRWNSVIPAGVAHTISNILVTAGLSPQDWASSALRIACWSVFAYVLWRYWPITEYDMPIDDEQPAHMAMTDPEPAV